MQVQLFKLWQSGLYIRKFILFHAIFLTLFGYLIYERNSKMQEFYRNDVIVNFHITENFTSFTVVQILFLISATPCITYQTLGNNLHLPYTTFAINIHTKCPLLAYIAIRHITTPFYTGITRAAGLHYMQFYSLTTTPPQPPKLPRHRGQLTNTDNTTHRRTTNDPNVNVKLNSWAEHKVHLLCY
jgi:hypothetical protein